MRLRMLLCALIVALFTFQTIPVAALDEGMWTFNNVPREDIKQKYGFDVTDDWLRKVQLASVRFNNGGSGSFVSPNGLVLTNYHIVEDIVGELSTANKDYAKEGFVARSQAEEMKAEGLELNQLISIEDVTARINGAVKSGMSAVEANAARRAEISAIERESTAATGLRSDVVTLYQGGQYNLYRYKKYTDVRLVFVPEFQAAFFGGDPDNFNFPRFNIDMSLVRVYENGQPVKVENYFKWSKTGAKDGELVFVTGHPGSTQRLNTVAHLESLRDVTIPLILRLLESRRVVLKQYMAQGEEQTRRAQNELNSIENSIKVYKGQIAGLKDPKLMAKKQLAEQALKNSISADPQKKQEYGADHPLVKRVLKGKTPEARAAELIEGTKLKNVEYRKQVATAGVRMTRSGDDPIIDLAQDIDKEARAVRKRYEEEVVAVERANYAKIAHALFEEQGTRLYPDATFTLRLSYGAVKGYREHGKFVPPFTTLGGLYARSNQFHHAFPYNLPPRWMSKRAAINPRTPFNFVSTNDIIGGNSGSPTINKNGELVGLIFDGNIESLVGNFEYDESVNRSISVDVRAMLEVLRKVFQANAVADELMKG